MRIAVLNWRDLRNPSAGGAEVFVHEVTQRWAAEHDVHLFTSTVAGHPRAYVDGEVPVRRIGRLHSGSHHLLAPAVVTRTFAPDVVLESVNSLPYLLPLRRLRCPRVTLVHQMAMNVWSYHYPLPIAAGARLLERTLFRAYRRSAVVAVSASTADDLRALGLTVSVVPQGGIGPQAPRTMKEPDPTVLYVGRLTRDKRPADAIEAFHAVRRRWPRARMWVVGEGPLRASLEASAPPGVDFLGRLERAFLIARMGRAHVLLATSVREGWGLVVTEANALGTPAVAYDVLGLRDSVRDGFTGVLCPENPAALAAGVIGLLEDRERYEAFCAAATTWGAQHTWDKTAAELMAHLIAIVEER